MEGLIDKEIDWQTDGEIDRRAEKAKPEKTDRLMDRRKDRQWTSRQMKRHTYCTDGGTDKHLGGRRDGYGRMDRCENKMMEGLIDKEIDWQTDGEIDRRAEKAKPEKTDRQMYRCKDRQWTIRQMNRHTYCTDGGTDKHLVGRRDGYRRMDRCANKMMEGLIDKQTDWRTDGQIDRRAEKAKPEKTDRQMDRRKDRQWTSRQMNRQTYCADGGTDKHLGWWKTDMDGWIDVPTKRWRDW